ncbi:VanZ family protein [Desulforhopalus sp. IMCC35007]|uniref:VanZ family protein n=1 Tax=Desulforhopalus sp. IMCC35007 TaxID=2569543 RepID=UPI0010ADEE17|nr:VanZ family protein [Desulforhopalus sp. IMCC35007]TKB07435.1 hypothetical protein FCL48_16980 [Desulforhopalus sp. IMCC35007]
MFHSPYKWCFLVLVIASPLFVWGGPDLYSHRLLTELWNLGHLVFFALFVVLLDHYWYSQQRSKFFRIFATLIVLLSIGLTTELIQFGIAGRYFSWIDLCRDISGGFIVLFWKISQKEARVQGALFRLIALLLLCINMIPLLKISFDTYHSYREFPLLAGFEHKTELSRWDGLARLSLDSQIHLQGNYSGKIELGTEQYSGVFLNQFPRNWSNHKALSFNVYNPGPSLQLHYRVHDNLHSGDFQDFSNRFNGSSVLDHGWNEIIIPMADILHGPQNRKMNLDKIQSFGIFVVQQKDKRIIYIDNVRLQQ